MLDGVTSFSHIKTYELRANASLQLKFLEVFLSCNVGKLETSERYACLFVVSCVSESK